MHRESVVQDTFQKYLEDTKISRACLYQLLIAIMNLIAKLGIIYTTACHASLFAAAVDCLSVKLSLPLHSAYYYCIYKHGTGRGRW